MQKLRVYSGPPIRWNSHFNGSAVTRGLKADDLLSLPSHVLREHVEHVDLKAVDGAWKLPKWPAADRAQKMAQEVWQSVAVTCNIGPRAVRAGADALRRGIRGSIKSRSWSDPPPKWNVMESNMSQAIHRTGQVLLGDDRDPMKAWTCSALAMQAVLLWSIMQDPLWSVENLSMSVVQL